jgi:hypothetical protein
MIKQVKSERRLHPRLEKKLPINVAANGYDFATSTQNISCVGVYCHVNKYIPPFTKIAIKIRLPKTGDTTPKECEVECKGVIVRTEDEKGGGFNIAIFFNEIKDSQRHKISRYISKFLPKNS